MYIELHARSAFSFLEGASAPEELIAACAEWGQAPQVHRDSGQADGPATHSGGDEINAMALLDRNGVYGAPRFYMAAKKQKIRAHLGAEVTSDEGWRYVLLAESRAGYQNLCRLITRMKLRARPPAGRAGKGEGCVSREDVAEYREGLVCLTGGEEGPLAHALTRDGVRSGAECLRQLTELFGRHNVYIELQRHRCRAEEARNQAAIALARQFQLPLLATNGVCYAQPREREILDVFTCIRHHCTLETGGRLLAGNAERYLKPPAEMARLFADLPEAIANTVILSARLQFTLKDLGYEFPRYPVPGGAPQIDFLRALTRDGMIHRYGASSGDPESLSERARRQIERELTLIGKLDLAGYFLIVWDIVQYCRAQNILVQGRGSAANSAVCYALGITAVDPVRGKLLFERFLSEERGEWPYIDLDLPSGDQRECAIQYLYERYGQLGAAMTANVISYRERSAAREIGKALGFDMEALSRLAPLVGAWEYKHPQDVRSRQFRDAGFDLRHPRVHKFYELCGMVQDLPRHLGQHSGGMVVCQGQLDSIVPLEPATMPGRVVVQWDKEDCADLGIVKVDLLGLGMMAVMEDSLKLIEQDYGEKVDLAKLPEDDKAVYNALQKADTVGMFQIESRAQMSCLPRLRPKCFYDIVVQVAIIRPGPIVGDMVNPYLKHRLHPELITYPHPSLEAVLSRTLGVPLFQEQLLRMAMMAAGFTGGQAEGLRRAFGFKRSEKRMKEVEVELREGMTKNEIVGEAQDKIVQSITSFALYGFPESHAISFALLAYASAYLKCHYLAAFTAAMLNNQPMGFYSAATLVKDAQRHGLKVKPIDVTCSDWLCTLEKRQDAACGDERFALRLGMRYARGLRAEIAQNLVRERAARPFASIEDLKLRLPGMQRAELVALAKIGALNSISGPGKPHRRDALWQIERAVRSTGPLLEAVGMHESKEAADAIAAPKESAPASPLAPMNVAERLLADFHGTGLTVGPHPMAYHRADLRRRGIRAAAELARIPHGTRVTIAGAVIARQRPGTAKGFVFLSLEDETGISNTIITPQLFERVRTVVIHRPFLLIEGTLQNQERVIS